MIEQAGLRIIAQKRVRITREQAETFYAVHKARPFFGELVDFMISGPVVVQVLEGDNAIAKYRDIMGATDPAKAAAEHHPQGPRQVDRRELGARLRRAGHGGEGNRPVLLRQRNRRLTADACNVAHAPRPLVPLVNGRRCACRLCSLRRSRGMRRGAAGNRRVNEEGSSAVDFLWQDMMHRRSGSPRSDHLASTSFCPATTPS